MKNNQKISASARVLVVDDDSALREEFKECFSEFGVREARDGEEALEVLKKPNEIDIVMLDVRMYGMDGIEVLNRIRQKHPDLKIVIMTGYVSKDIAVEALKGRADDFIEKPLDVEAVRGIIERTLAVKRSEKNGHEDYVTGKLERVKSFIKRNSFKKISLKDAAQIVSLSPKYLSRVFKERTGMGFAEYKLGLKAEKAKNVLKETNDTIDQIADAMGYKNTESFTRIFKKITGSSPTEFRNKARIKRANKNKI